MSRHKHLSAAALVVALLALVASLGGGSYAADLLTGKDIKNGSITGKDIKKNSLSGKQVKDKSLTGADLKDGSVQAADLAPGTVEPLKTIRVAATPGASWSAARAAAPQHVLYTAGPLTVYGKCFTDTSGVDTYAATYIRTSVNGAIVSSGDDTLEGGDANEYLNTNTPEDDRELEYTSTGPNNADYWRSITSAHAPDGTAISGVVAMGAKNGVLGGGNGVYGAGDACVFSASFSSN